jgi:hypothetical protein
MEQALGHFLGGLKELGEYLLGLKQLCCPFCGAAETLNCHSKLYGNDAQKPGGQIQRGQRVWCCDRGQRGGCGRTFSIFLADVLPRHTISAGCLWKVLRGVLKGGSIRATCKALSLPFALESIYHLLQRLRQRMASVRSALCRKLQPPVSSQTDPLLQTVEHLRNVFAQGDCPVADFQLMFQQRLLR